MSENENNFELKYLRAKDAIFRMIGQFCHCVRNSKGEYCIIDYCESALEASFCVLGLGLDEIPLMDFCKAWEENNRKIWAINFPDSEYEGCTAEIYYELFIIH